MKTDRYTRVMLTLIAVALWGLLLRDLLPLRSATAAGEPQLANVNLAQIGGMAISGGPIEVQFKQPIRVEGGNEVPLLTMQTLGGGPMPKK